MNVTSVSHHISPSPYLEHPEKSGAAPREETLNRTTSTVSKDSEDSMDMDDDSFHKSLDEDFKIVNKEPVPEPVRFDPDDIEDLGPEWEVVGSTQKSTTPALVEDKVEEEAISPTFDGTP